MKRLSLLRHAKSDRTDPAAADFDRGLTGRGRQAAPAMGRYLRRQKLVPDIVLCSAARRARETWELAAATLKAEIPVEYSERLYLASPGPDPAPAAPASRDRRGRPSDRPQPGISRPRLAARRQRGCRGAGAAARPSFPTAALAVIDFEVERWSDLATGKGELERFIVPRDLD